MPRRAASSCGPQRPLLLLEELQDGLRLGVGLGEHGRGGLHEDLVLHELHHLRGHVRVADQRLRGLQVLRPDRQALHGVLQPVLVGAEVRPLLVHELQRVVEHADGRVRPVRRGQGDEGRVAGQAVGALHPQALGGHRADDDLHALVHVRADVQPHAGGDHVLARGRGEPAREHVHAVELGVGGDPVDLVHQLGDLDLDLHPVLVGVDRRWRPARPARAAAAGCPGSPGGIPQRSG